MTQNDAKIDQNNAKKEDKSSILDKVLGVKEGKEEQKEDSKGLELKVKDLTESIQRLQAEFENYQKRNAKQNEEFKIFANAKVIEDILPVLDSLEQGMQHSKDLGLVYEQLNGILKKKGLEKIQIKKGEKFNHEEMECLMQEYDSKLPVDSVVNILMNGYKLSGKILRAARVSVNVLPEKKEGDEVSDKKETNKEKKDKKENEKETEEKNEHEGITKCDFEIKIMESD